MPLPRTDYSIKIKHTFRSGLLLGLGCFSGFFSPTVLAQSISYSQAEQSLLTSSYSTQANQALQQSAELQAQAIKGLGLPRVERLAPRKLPIAKPNAARLAVNNNKMYNVLN